MFKGKEEVLYLDLLDLLTESRLRKNPMLLEEMAVGAGSKLRWVVIDEVQRLPSLLNVVHRLIESTKRAGQPIHFAITSSSARKLRRGAANLLAGRALYNELFPLTHVELGSQFNLERTLMLGGLPAAYLSPNEEEANRYLETYAQIYLKEEIWNEHIVRQLEPFAAFLEIAAQCNGKLINFSKIGKDVGVDTKTVQSYYQILEDTLAGFFIRPFSRSVRKRQSHAPKFYLFDLGVKRALDGTLPVKLLPQTYAFGEAFEHFVILELHRLNAYKHLNLRFTFLRTHDDAEVDLVIEHPGKKYSIIEIKSSDKVDEHDLRSSIRIAKDLNVKEIYCLCREKYQRQLNGALILPWREGLEVLTSASIFHHH